MSFEFLTIALLVISLITNLTVNGLKKLKNKNDENYSSTWLAAVTSVAVSLAVSVGYLIITSTAFNMKIAVELIALMYLSWLVATNGYDTVIKMLTQIKKAKDSITETTKTE